MKSKYLNLLSTSENLHRAPGRQKFQQHVLLVLTGSLSSCRIREVMMKVRADLNRLLKTLSGLFFTGFWAEIKAQT